MTEERRGAPRIEASLAGEIETDAGRASVGITRDVSAAGLLLLTRARLDVGDTVKLRVAFRDREIALVAKVVRREPLDPEESVLWRTKVAVSVDDDPGLAEVMRELAAASK
jgi:hypothetical protein